MTWPLYGVIMFLYVLSFMTLFDLLFPKCHLFFCFVFGSFVEDKVKVFTTDTASMDYVCTFVCLSVRVFHKSQHHFEFL